MVPVSVLDICTFCLSFQAGVSHILIHFLPLLSIRAARKTDHGRVEEDSARRRKSEPEKLAMAARLRKETALPIKDIAARLRLGTSNSAKTNLPQWMQTVEKQIVGHGSRKERQENRHLKNE